MEEWWNALGLFMQSVWCITLFASLVFIIQTILTFVGMDADGGMDVDMGSDMPGDGDAGPFQLFTFRNFINFLLGFGWSIISFQGVIQNQFILILVAAVIGVLLVIAVMAIFRFMSRMEQSGTIQMANAVGCRGNVYLKIPANKRGEGKVQISIQGAIREFDAITLGEELETGAPIQVVEVVNDSMLLVERF
ncbi:MULTISPECIES: NfeD family protein [Butyricimonas]|uniref:NfeD family protein n=1 Tax=Butyricimonas TaxID=574697 RepID=UPI0007FB4B75|nr:MULTISPECIES: NfeD family protein [Butyricimonas]